MYMNGSGPLEILQRATCGPVAPGLKTPVLIFLKIPGSLIFDDEILNFDIFELEA